MTFIVDVDGLSASHDDANAQSRISVVGIIDKSPLLDRSAVVADRTDWDLYITSLYL
jgi:hypothetical protein